jgi:hypothetical protein
VAGTTRSLDRADVLLRKGYRVHRYDPAGGHTLRWLEAMRACDRRPQLGGPHGLLCTSCFLTCPRAACGRDEGLESLRSATHVVSSIPPLALSMYDPVSACRAARRPRCRS